jgi:drug/metabolite transporter (DMT)-like permease
MRLLQVLGVVLILGGIFLFVRGVNYTSNRSLLEVGDFKATFEEKRPIPPWVGGLAVGTGVVLLIVAAGKRR